MIELAWASRRCSLESSTPFIQKSRKCTRKKGKLFNGCKGWKKEKEKIIVASLNIFSNEFPQTAASSSFIIQQHQVNISSRVLVMKVLVRRPQIIRANDLLSPSRWQLKLFNDLAERSCCVIRQNRHGQRRQQIELFLLLKTDGLERRERVELFILAWNFVSFYFSRFSNLTFLIKN